MPMPRTALRSAVVTAATVISLAFGARPLAAAPPAAPQASTGPSELLVPGGTGGVMQAAGVRVPPARWNRLLTLIRVMHGAPAGASKTADETAVAVAAYLDAITRLKAATGQSPDVTLKAAVQKAERKRLENIFDVIGLKLRERKNVYSVERSDDREASQRCAQLARAGVSLEKIDARLNGGQTVRLEIPVERIRLPLPAKLWADVVFERDVPPDLLFEAIILDRRAALLYHGLASLDQPSLDAVASDKELLKKIARDTAEVFSTLGRSVRVRAGAVLVPGPSDDARPLWEALVEEKASTPGRFIKRLFEKDDGRLAWFYDSVQHLDPAHQRYALCLGAQKGEAREECFKSVYTVFRDFEPGWNLQRQPFLRRPVDPFLVLTQLHVTPKAETAPPSWKRLWQEAFDASDVPDDPARKVRRLTEDGFADVAWLLRSIVVEDAVVRRMRLEAVVLSQRLFANAPPQAAADVLVVAAAFGRCELLPLTLERAGVRDPAIYAKASRLARTIMAEAGDALPMYLAGFQAPIAYIERAASSQALERAGASDLVKSFLAIPRGPDAPAGVFAQWVERELAPRIRARVALKGSEAAGIQEEGVFETLLLAGLAGPPSTSDGRVIHWEGHAYRVDVATAEMARLRKLRTTQKDTAVDDALALWHVAADLSAPKPTLQVPKTAAQRLRTLAVAIHPVVPGPLMGVEPPVARKIVDKAIEGLGKVKKEKDLKKLPALAEPLARLADVLLVQTFASLVYASAIRDAGSSLLLAGNIAPLHEFGLRALREEERLRGPWMIPREAAAVGTRWHMVGSLLALDLGLCRFAVRRMGSEPPSHPPTLNDIDAEAYQRTVALMAPFALTESARDSTVSAVRAGRVRVKHLTADATAVESIAREAHLGEWRQQAIAWVLANEPDSLEHLFSLTELMRLGHPDTQRSALDAWGTSAIPWDGSLRPMLSLEYGWEDVSGYQASGLIAAVTADLNLRVAEALADRKLPAALAPAVLGFATQILIDEADLVDDMDWAAVVHAAGSITDAQIDDAISLLTNGGPLVAVESTDARRAA